LQVNGAKSVLRALMGSLLPMNFELKGELTAPDTLPPIEELRAMVLERHPTIALVEGQIRRAQEQLQLEQNLRYPQPSIMAGYERDPGLEQWLFGFSLPLPLWNQRQGPIAAAHAEIKQSEATANQQRLVLLREVEVAYTHYRIAARQEEAFESGLLKEAELALKVAETAYRHGARGILDYLDAQRIYQTVRQDYINARFDKQLAYIEIERLLADDDGD
jgi:cobalt-zinc-cadmium efflux system outer membrane protein